MNHTPVTPYSNQNDDVLQSMLKDSIHQFLTLHKAGITDFSNFISIFSRFLNNLPDPPLELIWFYSALTFHSSKFTTHNSPKDLFQLLVSCSSSSNAAKKIASLAPLIYEINCLANSKKLCVKEIQSFLEVIVSYISLCCCRVSGNYDEIEAKVSNYCFIELVRVWTEDRIGESCRFGDALSVFFPLISDGIRAQVDSKDFEIDCIAAFVMVEALLLSLCLKFKLGISGVELEKELRDGLGQMMSGFRSYCFYDTVLRMLLEPVLPVLSLLSSKEEVILRDILYGVSIKMDFSFFGPQNGIHLPDGRLKNLLITWLLVADKGMRFLRETGDAKVISYIQAFSESCMPSKLIRWATIHHKISAPNASTPLAIIRWLLIMEDEGVRVFDSDISKMYAKNIICKSAFESEFFIGKADDKGDGDLEMIDSEGTLIMADSGLSKAVAINGTRKRKEERHAEGDKQVKFLRCQLNDNSVKDQMAMMF